MARILSGKEVAEALSLRLVERVQTLEEKGVKPTLAILRVGERPDDLAYERGAVKRCEKLGVAVKKLTLSADCTQTELMEAIQSVNGAADIHGLLMLRPLPKTLNEQAACEALFPEKDVDCITGGSLARVFTGKGAGYPPCTAQACMELLDYYGCDLDGKRVTVVGRSLVIGKPVAMLLLARNATVTTCHTHTKDLAEECRRAEVLIVAAGKAEAVDGACVAPGQTVIDVGIHVDADGTMHGDADFTSVEPVVAAITPVPGGVGTVTSTVLAGHVIDAAAKAAGVKWDD
ncbi:tetrahydrofolate dehydrogenase/cyclohydrolase catalytic domain-containing protein [Oscillibacter sp.]|uniref:bifunctional 5,10-methylenetetrahydrofolate dehydrogenase/5,10-methenyltetrahydrofolate cyclohydrolase n=1 Tax=Oscillibacter sp. TaxID=1945593 RepID=UPI00289BB8BC|nr:tetrahydrofolate dehydrogenase/cyclohydrolase catalytic domain-containing protein [Oscillibacter sp.]